MKCVCLQNARHEREIIQRVAHQLRVGGDTGHVVEFHQWLVVKVGGLLSQESPFVKGGVSLGKSWRYP